MGGQRHASDVLPSGKARGWLSLGASLEGYVIYPPGFETQTIQSVATTVTLSQPPDRRVD